MDFDAFVSRGATGAPAEPVAIVGVGALYPGGRGTDGYWRLMTETALRCGCADAEDDPAGDPHWNRCGRPTSPAGSGPAWGLADVEVDLARFGVPPAQARSMARLQLLMLEAARQCLADAGHPDRGPGTRPDEWGDRTDVVVGTCFGLDRQHANALRIEAMRYVRDLEQTAAGSRSAELRESAAAAAVELRALLLDRIGCSSHDRIGEMASTIPARIAAAFKLRGRTLALEAAEATSLLGVAHAMDNLRGGGSDAVLVVAGQRRESRHLARSLAAKGLFVPGSHPFAAGRNGSTLGEGVGALLLKRLSSAERDGDRIYATVLDCSLRHDARPGVFRHSVSVRHRQELAADSYRAAAVPLDSVGFIECAGPGGGDGADPELVALGELFGHCRPGSVALGDVRDRLGHTLANAGVASITKVALALHRGQIPPQWTPGDSRRADLAGTPVRLARGVDSWPAPPGAGRRRAAVLGSSFTGTLCHLVLEEYPASPANGRWRSVTVREPAAIAVVGMAGRFAGSPDAAAFWDTNRSGRDRLGALPDTVLDRDLYYSPGELSLIRSYTDQGGHLPVPDGPPAGLRIIPRRYAGMDAAQRIALAVAGELLAPCGPGGPPGRGLVAVGSTLTRSRERRIDAELSLPDLEAAVADVAALAHVGRTETAALLDTVRQRFRRPEDDSFPSSVDGCLASGIAAVIANEYRLGAVPVAVEAACASSLAALDVAVAALRSGAADYAIAGGVELPCNARDLVLCSALGLLSHTKITPFDAAADGFTPGDGCALFLLRRCEDARRDGDRILGLIRGIGAANDAKSVVAPDVEGQVRAMRAAFGQVDFGPSAVDYLEAHGTGTRVGDRVEITATAQVYGAADRCRPLRIGSAKSFVGHTFAAAGGAGLLRALQAIRERTVPATANLCTVDPALELAAIPAAVPTAPSPWVVEPGCPRRAGVSSFGTGGINYHVLVEEWLDGLR